MTEIDLAYAHHVPEDIHDAMNIMKLLESRFSKRIKFSFRKRNCNSITIQTLPFDEFIHDLDDKSYYWVVIIDKTNPFHTPAYFKSKQHGSGTLLSVSCSTPAQAIKDMIDILMHNCTITLFDNIMLSLPAFSSFLELKMILDIYGKDSFISKKTSPTCIEDLFED